MDKRSYWTIGRGVAAAVLLIGAQSASAASAAAEEAQALMAQGQFDQALKKLEGQLKSQPQDAEARFLRGLALVKLNRGPEAIKVFADLTRDYPQLPEPYNNLAVLYAQQGDYEKARDALEAALATHPAYATAHENLGDIYAALAGAAYNRALALDQANQTVRTKLALVGQLDSAGKGSSAAPMPTVPPPFAAPRTAVAPASAAAVESKPVIAPPPAPAAPAFVPAPAIAATPAAAPTAAVADDVATQASVAKLLDSWTSSWSAKDVDGYFATYAPSFVPEGGLGRPTWEAVRRDRISRPKRISVRADGPKVSLSASGRVSVSFIQEYESDTYSDKVSKTLELVPNGSGWLIVREYTR